jgi:hypothetical protein
LLGGLEIAFHEHRGNREYIPNIVEAVAGIVGGEFICGTNRNAEQVVDRLIVFGSIQTPDGHASRIHYTGGAAAVQLLLDPAEHGLHLGSGRSGKTCRGHLSVPQLQPHFIPENGIGGSGRRVGKLETHVSCLQLVVVTTGAMANKKTDVSYGRKAAAEVSLLFIASGGAATELIASVVRQTG